MPKYYRSKGYFSRGWWELNVVLILFVIQFLRQYAFNLVDRQSADRLLVDFVIFSTIFCFVLILLFNLVMDDAEKNKKSIENSNLKNVAYIDTLTRMQNRAAYVRFIKRQTSDNKNNKDKKFICAVLDIDGFKRINDTIGHIPGDEILKQMASIILAHFERIGCECFRIGGDEFVILMEDTPISDAEGQIKEMNDKLLLTIGVTVSYGCSEVNFGDAKPFETAFKKADGVMYSNKQQKKAQT